MSFWGATLLGVGLKSNPKDNHIFSGGVRFLKKSTQCEVVSVAFGLRFGVSQRYHPLNKTYPWLSVQIGIPTIEASLTPPPFILVSK